jgi:cytochrome c peroxidase
VHRPNTRSWDTCSGCRCSPRSPSRSCSAFSALASLLAGLLLASCGSALCDTDGCFFTKEEWQRLESLTNLPDPPLDRSNKYSGDPAAARFGQQLYFDPRFSGNANLLDSTGRLQPYARAPKGEPIDVSCASCHDPALGGIDRTSTPNNVSIGAGWYDVNSQPTKNAAYYDLVYWNMRVDSLWAQIVGVSESGVSMNGNRVHIARVLHDSYASTYASIFPDHPLPFMETEAQLALRLDAKGQCMLDAGRCPTELSCLVEMEPDGTTGCWPRFPIAGKPGKNAGCQRGDPNEPFGDAFDCMSDADQTTITRIYVNFAKAIAAYERALVSKDAPFDEFVKAGPQSTAISSCAVRGAKLFVSKASCIDCHNTPLFSDNKWHNVGAPQIGEAVPTIEDCDTSACDCTTGASCLPWGVYNGISALKKNKFRRDSMWSDDPTDSSRAADYALSLSDEMKGAWRTPGLRDVALTAPYMHDGSFATLADVVHHYNNGTVGDGAVEGSIAVQFQPIYLTDDEEGDLVEFLKTLTGAPLSQDLLTAPPAN